MKISRTDLKIIIPFVFGLSLIITLLCISAYLFINFKMFQIYGVQMEPTLKDGQRIMVQKNFTEIERDAIIIYEWEQNGEKHPIISRVKGMPGDMVRQEGNIVILENNNEIITTAEISPKQEAWLSDGESFIIPDNTYFVLGDNRDNSLDSRYKTIGTVSREEIIGTFIYKR